MAIISASDRKNRRYANTHVYYSVIYVCITIAVLIFLNVYTSLSSHDLFSKSKESAMLEKCRIAASQISDLEQLTEENVANAMAQMEEISVTRLIITDQYGKCVYDSYNQSNIQSQFVLFPEVVKALESPGNRLFHWQYHDGAITSRAAIPVTSYGILTGSVYMLEYDLEQGAFIRSIQYNILTISLLLVAAVIIFSVIFSSVFRSRLRKIVASIRSIRQGNYNHTVKMTGHDELAMLGDEFDDLTEKLQTSENKRHRFVSDASHELKTPLASIKLLSDSILHNEMDMGTVREFVGDIGNEADRLNRMTQKLLSLSRIDGQPDADCEIIYMAPTLQRVVRMLSGLAAEQEITIETDLSGDSPVLILEDDLYQIAFNLVENGIKYNVRGGKLAISLLAQDDNAIMQIKDTGMGIPEDAMPHIFERFYRVDKARSRKTGGSGLGLAIVRTMVERNQGSITVDSQVGNGTTFTVTFPIFDIGEEAER